MPPVKKKKPEKRRLTFLRQWREVRGLVLEKAAERLEIHHTTLMRIERGESPYNQDFLEKAALAYGCDVEDFFTHNPLIPPDMPRLTYDALKDAPAEIQEQAYRYVTQFLLKAS